jgi:hypothetical protein
MNYQFKLLAPLAIAAMLIATSCNEQKTTTTSTEQVEIQTMDSTSKVLKETNQKLEEQTKKVEASLEKLDTEFETNN